MKTDFWYALTVIVPREEQEILGALLFQQGALGLENHPESLVAYFSAEAPVEKIRNWLKTPGGLKKTFPAHVHRIPAENWQENWKENFRPLAIGERFLVTPSWEEPENPGGRLILKIDPGMAFGTGTHETTQLVLKLMENRLKPGQRLWDVGTGSGILSIAAARLGLTQIVANDVDPLAIEAAQKNARINGVADKISFFVGAPEAVKNRLFDVILVNMISSILYEILPEIVLHLEDTGLLIISGTLSAEREAFFSRIAKEGLVVEEIAEAGEWMGLVTVRRAR